MFLKRIVQTRLAPRSHRGGETTQPLSLSKHLSWTELNWEASSWFAIAVAAGAMSARAVLAVAKLLF
jgi:hypothetical protein